MNMQSYRCTVRLDGELGQTVPKTGISAAHVIMLKVEHEDDGVIEIFEEPGQEVVLNLPEEDGPRKKTMAEERSFLESEFGVEKVSKVFGSHFGSNMPKELPNDMTGYTPLSEDERKEAIAKAKKQEAKKAPAAKKPSTNAKKSAKVEEKEQPAEEEPAEPEGDEGFEPAKTAGASGL